MIGICLTKKYNLGYFIYRLTGRFINESQMPQKENRKEARKRQILDAASEVFSKKGFHEARMDDIVNHSGLSKGTLYWYFTSKDEIITCIMDELFAAEFDNLKDLQYSDLPAKQRIKMFTKIVLDDAEKYSLNAPIIYEFISSAGREMSVRETLKSYLRSFIEILKPIIQQGIDNDEFQKFNPQDAAFAIGSIIEGIFLLWIYDPETVDLHKQMDFSIDLLLGGMSNTNNL